MCMVSAAELNTMIETCLQKGNINEARKLFDENPTSRSSISWNMMMSGHVQYDQIHHAKDLFDEMPVRVKDVVSWNIMLSGFRRSKHTGELYRCFMQMGRDGVSPNDYTLSTLLRAIVGTHLNVLVPQIHARSVRMVLHSNKFVGSALITAYASLGKKEAFVQVFDEILMKNIICWNALFYGYMELGHVADAQRTFDLIPESERNVACWTCLVYGYIRNKQIDKARCVFNKMRERNVVSWTAMISGYAQNSRFVDALELFVLMLKSETRPNHFTFSSVLDACSGYSSLLMGQQIHQSIIKCGITEDVISLTSLVDMYAKCGDMNAAYCVFESILNKNSASWNSIIGGCARHGLANRALEEFSRMEKANNVTPNEITYINVLSACVHAGLVEEGEKHFLTMQHKYGIRTELEHYTCMVDLYGRAGQLDKAQNIINNMPFQPDVVLWGAFLSACGLHSDMQLGEFAAEKMRQLQKNHPASYHILSKIQGEKGLWSSVNELKDTMNERHARKQRAISWVE